MEMDVEQERETVIDEWLTELKKGTDYDLWGQPIEATNCYKKLAVQIRQYTHVDADIFKDDQKKVLGKAAACVELRCKTLQNPAQMEEISLDDLKRVERSLRNIETEKSKDFPIEVNAAHIHKPVIVINQENMLSVSPQIMELTRLSEDGDDDFVRRTAGNLLPAPAPIPGQTMVTVRIEKIGLKDASEHIDPFITISVRDHLGLNLMPSQETPVATHRDDTYIYFNVDVHLQRPLEILPHGFAIFYEFRHFKPKKNKISTKCWTFQEKDEMAEGPCVMELYRKPTHFKRKKINLLTIKPLYLHCKLSFF